MSRRVLIVSEDYPPYPGGVAHWAAGMAAGLTRLHHRVTVLTRERETPTASSNAESPVIVTIRGRRWRQFRTWYFRQAVRKLLRRESFDAVIATTWNAARGIEGPVRRSGARMACVAHGLEVTRRMPILKRRWLVRTLCRCQDIVAVSTFTRDSMADRFGFAPARILVLPNGVDPDRFRPGADASAIQQRHGLEGKSVILTLARIVERKGHDLVIRAMPRILQHVPQALYVIAGTDDGGQAGRLRGLAEELGVGPAVVFAGALSAADIPLYYNACDVYVMASRELPKTGDTEGFGITFLEANACGKPVIGGRSGGVADAVEDGVTGFLIDPSDAEELANRVIRLLTEPGLAAQMGRAGRARVLASYTWDRIAAELAAGWELHTDAKPTISAATSTGLSSC
jgi:phosphatidylinositol alpha-1,6-mannosyltransferase